MGEAVCCGGEVDHLVGEWGFPGSRGLVGGCISRELGLRGCIVGGIVRVEWGSVDGEVVVIMVYSYI